MQVWVIQENCISLGMLQIHFFLESFPLNFFAGFFLWCYDSQESTIWNMSTSSFIIISSHLKNHRSYMDVAWLPIYALIFLGEFGE
jgi:hypothetical protein